MNELLITRELIEDDLTKKMQFSFDFFSKTVLSMRAGKIDISIIERIKVESYGNKGLLSQVASVNLQSAKVIVVNVWDISNLANVKKGIIASDLGFGIVSEGNSIKLTVPDQSEERRKELVKRLKDQAEEARIAIRNIRRKESDVIKKSKIAEDCRKKLLLVVDKITDDFSKKIDVLVDKKSNDIMYN